MAGRAATDGEAIAVSMAPLEAMDDPVLNDAVGAGDEPTRTADMVKHGGGQRLYAFQNGYGASVIRSSISYGAKENKWELAVIAATRGVIDVGDSSTWSLCYDTPITNDVIGWLSGADVDALLAKIEALQAAS